MPAFFVCADMVLCCNLFSPEGERVACCALCSSKQLSSGIPSGAFSVRGNTAWLCKVLVLFKTTWLYYAVNYGEISGSSSFVSTGITSGGRVHIYIHIYIYPDIKRAHGWSVNFIPVVTMWLSHRKIALFRIYWNFVRTKCKLKSICLQSKIKPLWKNRTWKQALCFANFVLLTCWVRALSFRQTGKASGEFLFRPFFSSLFCPLLLVFIEFNGCCGKNCCTLLCYPGVWSYRRDATLFGAVKSVSSPNACGQSEKVFQRHTPGPSSLPWRTFSGAVAGQVHFQWWLCFTQGCQSR